MDFKLHIIAICSLGLELAAASGAVAGEPPESTGLRIAQFHFKQATRMEYSNVLFATNRAIDQAVIPSETSLGGSVILPRLFDIDKIFLSSLGTQVALGRIEVDYPADRKFSEQTYSSKPSDDNPFRNFSVSKFDVFQNIDDWLGSSSLQTQPLARDFDLIYIHGFNVPFSSAVAETSQLKDDLGFQGPMLLFSWPSNLGLTVPDYRETERREELTVRQFSQVLEGINGFRFDDGSQAGGRIVGQAIAHSMGAKLVLDTLNSIHRESTNEKRPFDMVRMRTLILAAADVSRREFRERDLPLISDYADRTIIICSKFDIALRLSSGVNAVTTKDEMGEDISLADERLGQCSDYDNAFKTEILSGRLKWYQFRGVKDDFIGHSYFTYDPQTLFEMKRQLN